ncbi:hypothetical protein POSPLADRAFT_1069805 [Postia placenta MAD-698-R-SB12]|uniref:DUF6534 domain-containing protein n=1 Tax=Postia placenta MAD-698-R-SB12 TaxID=670580 RepID=A0A1X6N4G2_9APHY|nr:hypothetical protein POSPLADRAFT_1069805 [Postia placenta MAD-698-R-SB12]OSX63366.1 hypothetical protein POSPLADRAFT_1069805 [Postia placenta MAD-698-R-SB12]
MAGIEETFGALLVGVFIAAIFFGMTNLQVYVYFRTYAKDRTWIKAAVCYLWIIDALCVAFSFHMMYYYLVVRYSNPSVLDSVVWSYTHAYVEMTGSRHLEYYYGLLGASTVFVLAGCGEVVFPSHHEHGPLNLRLILAATIGLQSCNALMASPNALLSHGWITYFPLSVWTCTDAVIAASLCYMLRGMRTGSHRTDSLLSKLMLYAVNTGVSTSLLSLSAIIIVRILQPADTPTLLLIHGKGENARRHVHHGRYRSSPVKTLNARQSLREEADRLNEGIDIPSLSPIRSGSFSRRKSTLLPIEGADERMEVLRIDLSGSAHGAKNYAHILYILVDGGVTLWHNVADGRTEAQQELVKA